MKYSNTYVGDTCAPCAVPPSPETQYDKNLNEIYYQLERSDSLLTNLTDRLYKVLYPDYPQKENVGGDCAKSTNSPLVDTLEHIYIRQAAINTRINALIERIQL